MIFDLFFMLVSTVLNFIYEVIQFPLRGLGFDLGSIFEDFGLAQIYGFVTDILFPPGFLLIFFSYISVTIAVDLFLSVIDRRKS